MLQIRLIADTYITTILLNLVFIVIIENAHALNSSMPMMLHGLVCFLLRHRENAPNRAVNELDEA